MPDVPSDKLRDTFFIWIYATTTAYSDIRTGKLSSANLLTQLETGGHIKAGQTDNGDTADHVCKAIRANPNEFLKIKTSLKNTPILLAAWGGGESHPHLQELDSVFVAP
jgi:hypothetical protein